MPLLTPSIGLCGAAGAFGDGGSVLTGTPGGTFWPAAAGLKPTPVCLFFTASTVRPAAGAIGASKPGSTPGGCGDVYPAALIIMSATGATCGTAAITSAASIEPYIARTLPSTLSASILRTSASSFLT